jgi:ribose/xylose/arabinose/galactoside ABC-type transport system permease subunit
LRLAASFAALGVIVGLFAFASGDLVLDGSAPFVRPAERWRFLTVINFQSIAIQTAIVAACAAGMTAIVIGGGIDLSVGAIVVLSAISVALVHDGGFAERTFTTVFLGRSGLAWGLAGLVAGIILLPGLFRRESLPRRGLALLLIGGAAALLLFGKGPVAATFAGLATGTLAGLLNGWIITTTRVWPFIATLGTMEIFRGLALLVARRSPVAVDRMNFDANSPWLSGLMAIPDDSSSALAPLKHATGVYATLAAAAAVAFILLGTRLGRHIFAIGSNEKAARLSGVPVERVKLWLYGLAGLLAGLAGVMQFSRLGQADPTASIGLELKVVAAVVIGGASLRGGEGSILGTLIGALIMQTLENGCVMANIPNETQRLLVGAAIVLAVAFDEYRHRRG